MITKLFMFTANGLYTEQFATMRHCESAIQRLAAQFGPELEAISACIVTGFSQ